MSAGKFILLHHTLRVFLSIVSLVLQFLQFYFHIISRAPTIIIIRVIYSTLARDLLIFSVCFIFMIWSVATANLLNSKVFGYYPL